MLNTLPVPSVVNQDSVDLGKFRRMVFHKRIGAYSALLFTGEQDKCDGALRLPSQGLQRACRLQHRHRTGAIVERALAQVPGVKMSADNDALVRQLGAFDLGHGDRGWRRLLR